MKDSGKTVFQIIEETLAGEFSHFLSFTEYDEKEIEPLQAKGKRVKGGVTYSFIKNGVKYSFLYLEKAKWSLCSLLHFQISTARTGALCFSLEEIIAYRQLSDFRCCVYPYLRSAEEAKLAFRTLASVYLKNGAAIEEIFEKPEELYRFLLWKREEMIRYMNTTPFTVLSEEEDEPGEMTAEATFPEMPGKDWEVLAAELPTALYTEAAFLRRVDRTYTAFLQGNYAEMLRRWEKMSPKARDRLPSYEKQLAAFAKSLDETGGRFDAYGGAIQPDRKALASAQTDSDLLRYVLLTLPLCFVLFTLLFAGVHFGVERLFFGEALYSTARESGSVLFQCVPALPLSIAVCGFPGRLLQRKCAPEKAAARESYLAILQPRTAKQKKRNKRLVRIFAGIALLLVLLLVSITMFSGVRFYGDRLTVSAPAMMGPFPEGGEESAASGLFKTVTVPYADLAAVIEKPDRINPLGERLEYPSYVLQMKDGGEFDLYGNGEYGTYREPLAALFAEKGIPLLQGTPEPSA